MAAFAPSRPHPAIDVAAYRAYAATGLRQELASRSVILARGGFLAIILLVFSRVWSVVLESGAIEGRTRADLIWYLMVTELVALSFPYLHLEVESDLKSGNLVARLPEPISYLGARVAEAGGRLAGRLAFMAPMGIVLALVFGGGFPQHPAGALLALPLLVIAAFFGVVCSAAIGVGALWLHDASPLFWIWQKLVFLLGGLLLPLEIYPGWLRSFAEWTPFAAMLYRPASMVFGFDAPAAALAVTLLLAWLAVTALGLTWLWGRALHALQQQGG